MATRKKKRKKKGTIRKDLAKEYRERVRKSRYSTVADLSKDDTIIDLPGRVSTGSIVLDRALRSELPSGEMEDFGGLPMGRVTEIYGPPFVGKSTMLDMTFACVQRMPQGQAILFESEAARHRTYMQRLNVDLTKLHYHEFEVLTVERVFEQVFDAVKFWGPYGVPVVIGIDAFGGTPTEDELGKPLFGDKKRKPGAAAKLMSEIGREIPQMLAKTKIALVILNHEYTTFKTNRFGKPIKQTYGGDATAYVSSLRLNLIRMQTITDNKTGWPLGHRLLVEFKKNRTGLSRKVELALLQGKGIDNVLPIYEVLKQAGVIAVNGSWVQMQIDGQPYNFQGYQAFDQGVRADPELYAKLVTLYKERAP